MIQHILFDIDNTLYPASSAIDAGISRRMFQFIADFLGITFVQAQVLQQSRRSFYGTTLEWLECEYGFTDKRQFFDYVHPPCEVDELIPDPHLRSFLQSLDMPLSILTNAPMVHALRVLDFFNIRDLFSGIFDIVYHKGKGKPYPECFLNTLAAAGKGIEETLFVDDCPIHIQRYRQLGGRAVLVDECNEYFGREKPGSSDIITSIYHLPDILKENMK